MACRSRLTIAAGRLAATAPLTGLAACQGMQSALDPAGPVASQIAMLSWFVFAGAAVILLGVMVLALWPFVAGDRAAGREPGYGLIVAGGVALPVTVLTLLLIFTVRLGAGATSTAPEGTLRIEVVGKQFWWQVRYPGEPAAITANEIHIPVGQPVEIVLKSDDIIHSFWVPKLAGKLDMIPGHTNRLLLQADTGGVFRGQCAEYCGAQHARMAFLVIAQPPEDFAAWLERQRQPAVEPAGPVLERGRRLFVESGCGTCHSIRGGTALSDIGPDLTHVGSRRTLAAGTIVNNVGSLAGWIAGSQQIKPGNLMPSFEQYRGDELRALAAYLESLE